MLRTPAVDAEGYLIDPNDWSATLAIKSARLENIQLTDDHWDVIHFMREFPYGYVKQACRIAGMKRPRAWSTG